MTDLSAFLKARLDEDARAAESRDTSAPIHETGCYYYNNSYDPPECDCDGPDRALREVEAKRKIIAEHKPHGHCMYDESKPACEICGDFVTAEWPCTAVLAIAEVYIDHPDHPGEWPAQPSPDNW